MKKTILVLPALLFALILIAMCIASIPKRSDPAVTTQKDLLKDFVPDERFRSASQKWADTENYTILYRHQFRFGNGVGDPNTWFDWSIVETRDGANVQYSIPKNHRPLGLVYHDGLLYVEKGEEKTKLTIAEEEILSYLNEALPDQYNDVRDLLDYMTAERTNAIDPLSDSILATATAVQVGETVVVTFQLNQEEATAMLGRWEVINLYEADPDSIHILQGTYTVTFDQYGVITKTRCDVEMTYTLLNYGQTLYGYDSVEYILTYGDAKVEAPEKADTYTDVTDELEIPE